MTELKETSHNIDVPANTGVEGFIHAIREIIKKSRIQRVILEATGRVTYVRLESPDDAAENMGVSFSHVQPYEIIRNVTTRELSYPPHLGGADVLTVMFDAVATNDFSPICFATGVASTLWSWLYLTSGIEIQNQKVLFGYPVYQDQQLPDTALVLCAGIGDNAALIDTRLAVKVEMHQNRVLGDDMEIL